MTLRITLRNHNSDTQDGTLHKIIYLTRYPIFLATKEQHGLTLRRNRCGDPGTIFGQPLFSPERSLRKYDYGQTYPGTVFLRIHEVPSQLPAEQACA